MIKVNDEQIEVLVKALQSSDPSSEANIARLVGEGESIGFYHGMISAFVLSHHLVLAYGKDQKDHQRHLTQLISLAAARASQCYLEIKRAETDFPEFIENE